jgi:hypothetical protein
MELSGQKLTIHIVFGYSYPTFFVVIGDSLLIKGT